MGCGGAVMCYNDGMNQCPFDPTAYANLPLGMFHCPLCGDMVIAGMAHPEPFDDDADYQAYMASLADGAEEVQAVAQG